MFDKEFGSDLVVVRPDPVAILVFEGGFDFTADVAGGLEPALGGFRIFSGGEYLFAGFSESFTESLDLSISPPSILKP